MNETTVHWNNGRFELRVACSVGRRGDKGLGNPLVSTKRKGEVTCKLCQLEIKKATPTTTTVTGCARCGTTHRNITFTPLINAPREHSHFAICPRTSQPILMHFKVTPDEQPGS